MEKFNNHLLLQLVKMVQTFRIKDLEIKLKEVLPEDQNKVFSPNTVSKNVAEFVGDDFVSKNPGSLILGLGSGSGAMEIFYALKGAGRVVGVEKNKKAVEYAIDNARLNGVESKVEFLAGDMYEPVEKRKFGAIVHDSGSMAGPIARLTPWYPPGIEFGGEDGTETSEKTINGADEHLNRGGVLYMGDISLANFRKIRQMAKDKLKGIFHVDGDRFPLRINFNDCLKDPANPKEPHPVLKGMLDKGMIFYERAGSRLFWYLDMYKYVAPI